MKRIISIIGATLMVAITSQAQSTNGNFLTTLEEWGTSFNTNADYAWTNVSLEIGVDVKQVNLATIANELRVQKNFGKFNVGVVGQFYAFGTPFNVVEGQVGYDLINKYDFKATFDVCAGYDNLSGSFIGEPKLLVEKKMTKFTFADISMSIPFITRGHNNGTPSFSAGVGFVF